MNTTGGTEILNVMDSPSIAEEDDSSSTDPMSHSEEILEKFGDINIEMKNEEEAQEPSVVSQSIFVPIASGHISLPENEKQIIDDNKNQTNQKQSSCCILL